MIAAVIPAAGLSVRMGRPKLILPVGGAPLIARVVAAFRDGGAGRVIVVAAPADAPGASEIAGAARSEGAEVVVAASPPADMRASVELALDYLARGTPPTAILLAPGDSPGLNPAIVAIVIRKAAEAPGRIIVPRHGGRSGHPVLLPWGLAEAIPRLPAGVGVNALLAEHPGRIEAFDAGDPAVLSDLDTPEDYRTWADRA
jgi:molybdenum cofactor cytidylyltransferase